MTGYTLYKDVTFHFQIFDFSIDFTAWGMGDYMGLEGVGVNYYHCLF